MRLNVSSVTTVLVYALLVLIWATTPLAIVWTIQDLDPLWALLLRYWFASAIAGLILIFIGGGLSFDRRSLQSYSAGSLNLIGAQLFIYLAASSLSSSLMVLIYAFSPLIAGLIEHFVLKTQKLQALQWCGMSLAIIGLMSIFIDPSQTTASPLGLVLMLISIVCYLSSIFLVKRINAPLSAMSQSTGSLMISAVAASLMIPLIWSDLPVQLPSLQSGLSFIYTVVISSIVAMLCYFWLIKRLQASTFALSNMITPSIALMVGVFFNQEPMTLRLGIGLLAVLSGIGVYFYAMRRQRPD